VTTLGSRLFVILSLALLAWALVIGVTDILWYSL